MPWYGGKEDWTGRKEDERIYCAIESWIDDAREGLNQIADWRDDPQHAPSPGNMRPGFWNRTCLLVGVIGARFKPLDPAPLQKIYKAVSKLHTLGHGARQPPQHVLCSLMEDAVIVLGALERDIEDRFVYEDPKKKGSGPAAGKRGRRRGAVNDVALDAATAKQYRNWNPKNRRKTFKEFADVFAKWLSKTYKKPCDANAVKCALERDRKRRK